MKHKTVVHIIKLSLLLIVLTLIVSSCENPMYDGKRISDQPGTRWVSSDGKIDFIIMEDGLIGVGNMKTEFGDIDIIFQQLRDNIFCALNAVSCDIAVGSYSL